MPTEYYQKKRLRKRMKDIKPFLKKKKNRSG